ncbi:hypothetical protein KR51_00006700 [Rubidibacter lacunae KORDI 51-2]|uniref:Uncharacterized protein n=1 Tax=Rubidibacter lacunae KORDI 51-2 TaxID=582515 RepID=U5DPW4_9CHRO|nr:hypothetical protein [Rubidibacter lacunae]ERN42639.1 hypothetical protein KR51_00006700 [Rubidibacter lacunae KORDI 51-2]
MIVSAVPRDRTDVQQLFPKIAQHWCVPPARNISDEKLMFLWGLSSVLISCRYTLRFIAGVWVVGGDRLPFE